jgi:uncharacterized repeat protein (TIGR03803 family)
MKTKNPFPRLSGAMCESWILPVLIAWLNLVPAYHVTAQTFTTIKSFGIVSNITGFNPQSTLVQGPDGTLYGTATYGEASVAGTIFKMQPDGSGFTVLKLFTNSLDGANPYRGLALSSNVLYGTTAYGGISNLGTVFKIRSDGTGYTVLKNFTGSDGANPFYAGLTLSGGIIYGATYYGGSSNQGTLFKLNTDGTGYTVLKSYAASDGANPNAGLTLSGSVLYGTTEQGGSAGGGTVFSVNTDGTGYTVLNNFTGIDGDGRSPDGVLTLSGSVLYGTTYYGGSMDSGTVFKVNTDGSGYSVLKRFDYSNDGARPSGALLLSGGILYGTASQGGSSSYGLVVQGTVFKLNTNGTGYAVLKNFAGGTLDGATPVAGLILSGGVLYGTSAQGGSASSGTVFKLNADGTGYALLKQFAFSDGAYPDAPLTLSGGVLYGTTRQGGGGGNAASGNGTVFKVNTDGTESALLHIFTAAPSFSGTNSDGYWPEAGLVLSGNTLYGTAWTGGSAADGTVFAVNTDGTGFTTLHSFTELSGPFPYTNSDGRLLACRLVLSGNSLYGTAYQGGSGNVGTVFAVNTDGTGFSTLHSFGADPIYDANYVTNSDGALPYAGLILSGHTLYGTAATGGGSASGTLFALNTDGTGFRILHSFTATPDYPAPYTNSDGARPLGRLILSGNTLYGTASTGGEWAAGTVFAVNTDGTGFTNLHSFAATSGPFSTNSEGAGPSADLILSGNTLLGTARRGGIFGSGAVFAINTDGTGFTNLHSFAATSGSFPSTNSDGAEPSAGLIMSGNTLYGTAQSGGTLGEGTVFSLLFTPQLTITPAGVPPSGIILSWPVSYAGFDYTGYTLQSTTNLNPPVVWTTNSPAPVVIAGQNTVTNPVSCARRFYRLIH